MVKKDWKIKDFAINAWASPEGEESRNQGLSDNRSKAAQNFLKEQVEKYIKEKAKLFSNTIRGSWVEEDVPYNPEFDPEHKIEFNPETAFQNLAGTPNANSNLDAISGVIGAIPSII